VEKPFQPVRAQTKMFFLAFTVTLPQENVSKKGGLDALGEFLHFLDVHIK
jgi:hypothetical protein